MGIDRERLIHEFDVAIDQLERALRSCPEELWEVSIWPVPRTDPWVWPVPGVEPVAERTDESIQRFSAFWCLAYHALWFLDFYATLDAEQFTSPDYIQGGPEELGFAADGAVAVPGRTFSQESLLQYVEHGRRKIRDTVTTVTDADLARICPSGHPRAGESFAELLQVNLAHVKEHGGQLAKFLGARVRSLP